MNAKTRFLSTFDFAKLRLINSYENIRTKQNIQMNKRSEQKWNQNRIEVEWTWTFLLTTINYAVGFWGNDRKLKISPIIICIILLRIFKLSSFLGVGQVFWWFSWINGFLAFSRIESETHLKCFFSLFIVIPFSIIFARIYASLHPFYI